MNIYNSRFAEHFVRHQGMVSILTTRFGLKNGSQPLLITNKVKHSGKDHEKNIKSVLAVSNLHKLEYIYIYIRSSN